MAISIPFNMLKFALVILFGLTLLNGSSASSFSLRARAKDILDGASPPKDQDIADASENRIIGGADAALGDYPFFVSVRYYGNHYCGGALLESGEKAWVLTAAHCQFSNINDIDAIVSAYKTKTGHYTHILANVVQRIPHPLYNPSTQENDVALLRLDRPITEVEGVKVNVETDHPYDGELLSVIGMGNTNPLGRYTPPDTLQTVFVNTETHESCALKFSPFPINEGKMVCARAPGRDSCQGDSGGPLLDNNNKVVGVTSFGGPCASEYPGVYTRMSGVSAWICLIAPGSCADPEPIALVGALAPEDQTGQGAQASGDACDDDKHARFPVPGKGEKKCVWLDGKGREAFRDQVCVPGNQAVIACPETCGVCTDTCEDGKSKVSISDGRRYDCLWLSLRVHEQDNYCVEGHEAFDICRETCDSCQ